MIEIPRECNPEEAGPGAGVIASPHKLEHPLGPADIPQELVMAIRAYEPGDPGVTLSGYPALRAHILEGAEFPADFEKWAEDRMKIIPVASELLEKARSTLANAEVLPDWMTSSWFAMLMNPWAEDLHVAVLEGQTVLG